MLAHFEISTINREKSPHKQDLSYKVSIIKKEYGDRAKLLITEIDLLTYHIQANEKYSDMKL